MKNKIVIFFLLFSFVASFFLHIVGFSAHADKQAVKVIQEDMLSEAERKKIDALDPVFVEFLCEIGHKFELYKDSSNIELENDESIAEHVKTFYLLKMDFAPDSKLDQLKFSLVDLDKNTKPELLLSLTGESLNFVYLVDEGKLKLADAFGYRSNANIYEDIIHVIGSGSAFEYGHSFLKLGKNKDELEAIEEINIVSKNGTEIRTLKSKNKQISLEESNDVIKFYTQRPTPIWHRYFDYVNLKNNTVKSKAMMEKKDKEMREIKIWYDGHYLFSDVKPVVIEGSTFVPLRLISEALDYDVKWDNKNRQITISDEDSGKNLIFTVDSNEVIQNGKKIKIKHKTVLMNGRSFVPFRFIAEFFGKGVDYDTKTKTAVIGRNFKSDEYYKIKFYDSKGDYVSEEEISFGKMELKKDSHYEVFTTESELLSNIKSLPGMQSSH